MGRIRVLPESIVNQIAAGEVVERPASVVKELVENALDAEAHYVRIEILAGGKSLIRVSDDGVGMDRDDAILSLQRHATSKISSIEDLFRISTLGFRGEALPSIASVSRMRLLTRPRDHRSLEATEVIVEGGRIVDVRTGARAPGTTVEVQQLFYNVPARRKFLRSEETERLHIHFCLLQAALAHLEVGFSFWSNERLVWELPALTVTDGSEFFRGLTSRAQVLFGSALRFVPVDYQCLLRLPEGNQALRVSYFGETALRIRGLVSEPGQTRSTRSDMIFFVNRRPVQHPILTRAIIEAYHTLLMRGRFPVCIVFLELDPALIDVNVHPAKREVRFRLETQVRIAVEEAVRHGLGLFHRSGSLGKKDLNRPFGVESSETASSKQGSVVREGGPLLESLSSWPDLVRRISAGEVAAAEVDAEGSGARDIGVRPAEKTGGQAYSSTGGQAGATDSARVRSLASLRLRYVGTVGELYVIFESEHGLVLMDQHAAHERVLFERVFAQLEQGPVPVQRLLLPQTVDLPSKDAAFVRMHLDRLSQLGIHLREFGANTFLLDALPAWIKIRDSRQFILDLVEELLRTECRLTVGRLSEVEIVKSICRHAVKAHNPLAEEEIIGLLEQLRNCSMPYTCPHGRPTMIELSFRELERRFGRLVT